MISFESNYYHIKHIIGGIIGYFIILIFVIAVTYDVLKKILKQKENFIDAV